LFFLNSAVAVRQTLGQKIMLDKDYCWKGAKKIKKNESVFVILNIAMPSR